MKKARKGPRIITTSVERVAKLGMAKRQKAGGLINRFHAWRIGRAHRGYEKLRQRFLATGRGSLGQIAKSSLLRKRANLALVMSKWHHGGRKTGG